MPLVTRKSLRAILRSAAHPHRAGLSATASGDRHRCPADVYSLIDAGLGLLLGPGLLAFDRFAGGGSGRRRRPGTDLMLRRGQTEAWLEARRVGVGLLLMTTVPGSFDQCKGRGVG